MPSPMTKVVRKFAFALIAIVIMLSLVEGLLSLGFFGWDVATKGRNELAEFDHTNYDPELGWLAAPDVSLDDFYGAGRHLRTNSQGFRNSADIDAEAGDKVRVVCSGDSFTLGYGVSNEDTWTAKLQAMNERLEVVNMGQGGYGVDQAWLWYERERELLEHHVHVFSFIENDFERLRQSRFYGHSKPVLRLEDGELSVTGTPVSRFGGTGPWMARKGEFFERLSLWRLAKNLGAASKSIDESRLTPLEEARDIVSMIFSRLRAANSEANRKLLLVYLPTRLECVNQGTLEWRAFVAAEAEKQDIDLLDLTETFRELPMGRLDSLFITANEVTFPGAAGHYSPGGNAVVARALRKWLAQAGLI